MNVLKCFSCEPSSSSLIPEECFRHFDENAATKFFNCSGAFPLFQNAAGCKQAYVSQTPELLVGDVNLHTARIVATCAVPEVE